MSLFVFGNNQSLTSSYRIQIPLLRHDSTSRKLWLAIEVVPGSTPFLFSKKAFKQFGGIFGYHKGSVHPAKIEPSFFTGT